MLSVRHAGTSAEVLIRFDASGEARIGFGFGCGVLEFEAQRQLR